MGFQPNALAAAVVPNYSGGRSRRITWVQEFKTSLGNVTRTGLKRKKETWTPAPSHLSNAHSHPLVVSWGILSNTQFLLDSFSLNKRTEDRRTFDHPAAADTELWGKNLLG